MFLILKGLFPIKVFMVIVHIKETFNKLCDTIIEDGIQAKANFTV
jgi:hypothetical protein